MTRFKTNHTINTGSSVSVSASGNHTTIQQQQGQSKNTFQCHKEKWDNNNISSRMATLTAFPHPQHQSNEPTRDTQKQGFGRQVASCSNKPSIHPTQTASYDIKSVSSSSSRKDPMESRVNSLCMALAQGIDVWHSPPVPPANDNAISTCPREPKIRPTTFEELIADMAQMKLEFDKRLSQVVQDYEETGAIVRRLYSDLQMKQEEIKVLRVKYEISVNENGLLYDAFNSEIAHLSTLVNNSPLDLEGQWQKKWDTTLKERNQWHQTACLLARELQEVTMYFDSATSIAYQSGDDTTSGLSTTATEATAKNPQSMVPPSSGSTPMIR